MRRFQYRLEPVVKLKKYQIERKEQEISELETQILILIQDIEDGRKAVHDMRRRLVEEVPDENLIQAERSLDLFQNYMAQVEREKQSEIKKLRSEQDKKRKELVKLYQEEKMLEKLRERRKTEWEAEMSRQEGYEMDEIGTQGFHRHRERGGALLYLLVPILLVGAVATIGIMTGTIKEDVLKKIPYLGTYFRSATAPVEIPAATAQGEYFTLEEMIGDPDAPMPQLLQNMADRVEQLQAWENRLREREEELKQREEQILEHEQQLSDLVSQVTQQVAMLNQLKTERAERVKSELSEREQELADAISKAKADDVAPIINSLFTKRVDAMGQDLPPEEIKENRMIVLRILHRVSTKGMQELVTEIGETNPDTAAEMIKAYYETSTEELYDLQPTPSPAPTPEALLPPMPVGATPTATTGTAETGTMPSESG